MLRALFVATLLIVASNDLVQAQDQSLPEPTQQVILTITGKIDRKNHEAGALFDRPMLEALGFEELRTSSPWTNGTVEFVGVPARRVMEAVGARGTTVIASALDNYRVEIPISDFERYPVLLALMMDGQELPSERGSIWIVYPQDDFPELQKETINARWIWQLSGLMVE